MTYYVFITYLFNVKLKKRESDIGVKRNGVVLSDDVFWYDVVYSTCIIEIYYSMTYYSAILLLAGSQYLNVV